MYKIENLQYSKGILKINGYTTIFDDKIVVLSGHKKVFEGPLNTTRPDIQSLIENYDYKKCYGFDYKIEGCKCHFKVMLVGDSGSKVIYKTSNYYIRKKLSNFKRLLKYFIHAIKILWKDYHFLVPLSKWKEFFKIFYRKVIKNELFDDRFYNIFSINDYNKWLMENDNTVNYKKLKYNPKISLIIPVYNVKASILKECIDSILNQSYKNFEICLVDDSSTKKETIDALKQYEKEYSDLIKVKYRGKNGHISVASNDAIKMATGEFIGLIDNDDTIDKDALYYVVQALNDNKKLDMIYSDEDKINTNGLRCDPHFKPDFSLDTLYSHNYICHFTVLRTSIVKKIGGFRKGYEGSQDYDLFLRFVEETDNIYHIPKILYHWRMVPGSTSMEVSNKSYAVEAGIKSLNDMLKRRKIMGTVENYYTSYIINYDVVGNPLVSIIIPTRDKVDVLKNCINSIIEKTSYNNYEIIVMDNGSVEEKTILYFDYLKTNYKNIRIIRVDDPFNFSLLNNIGVKNANGEYVVLLNNDIEIISNNWINIMLGYAMQKHVGAVGPKLLFANKKIQHAGVVLGVGVGHIANHAFYLEDEKSIAPAGRLIVPYDYSAVTGACIMISKKKYNQVSGLEEKLAVNYNDIDFCLKLLDKGYYNVFLPQVELFHLESISRGKITNEAKQKQYEQEKKYMQSKWKKYLDRDVFYNPNYSTHKCFMLDKKDVEYED